MRPEQQIRRYHAGILPFTVEVYLDTYDGPAWVRQHLRGRCGWVQVSRAMLSTPISEWSASLVAAISDDGQQLGKVVSSALLNMRSSNPQLAQDDPPEELEGITEMLFWDFLGGCDIRHLRMLERQEAEIAAELEAEQERGDTVLAEVEHFIAGLQKQRRAPDCALEARDRLEQQISFFQQKQAAAEHWLVRHLAEIRRRGDAFEADVLEALQNHGEIEELYQARWVARSQYDRLADRAYVTDTLRMAALSGVPHAARIELQERIEMAEAKRLAKGKLRYVEPTRRRERPHGKHSKLHTPQGASTGADPHEEWRREARELLDGIESWKADRDESRRAAVPNRADPEPLVPVKPPEALNLSPCMAPEPAPAATKADDSLDIDALIESEMRDLLKDLVP